MYSLEEQKDGWSNSDKWFMVGLDNVVSMVTKQPWKSRFISTGRPGMETLIFNLARSK